MKTALLLLTSLAALTSLRAEDTTRRAINPALLYWQTAAQLPNLKTEQVTELRAIASGKKSVIATQWKDFHFENVEILLLRAAESTAPCDWGLPLELGPELPMPHISKVMEMGSIAVGEAEFQFSQGNIEKGQHWLIAAHRMARHVAAGDLLISYLVQCAIEQNALRCAARHCFAWDAPMRQTYQEKLKQLPPFHTLQESYQGEAVLVDWLDNLLKKDASERTTALKTLAIGVDSSQAAGVSPPVQPNAVAALEDPEKLRQAISSLRDYQKKTYEILGKPWKTAHVDLANLTDAAQHSDSILVRMLLPTTATILNKSGAITTLQTMLNAGLQYGAQLDAAHATEFHDDFEGSPLKFKKDSDGSITLQSPTMPVSGKITELRFSK